MLLVFLSGNFKGFRSSVARTGGKYHFIYIYIYVFLFHSGSAHSSHIGTQANSIAIISKTLPIILIQGKQLWGVVLPAVKGYSSEVTNAHNSCSQIFGCSHINSQPQGAR